MSSEAANAPTLELAHVLFMDVVAYSRLPIDQQERLLRQLQHIVRATADFARAQAADQLISLPTGDGMALVFFSDPESPVRCACEVSAALRAHPEIKLRMGVHTGPVYRVQDINANRNVAGGGVNIAQRVMDCADAGHILLSRATADVLKQVSGWEDALHDLGQAEVKHGVKVHLFNLCRASVGNPAIPRKLRAAARRRKNRRNLVVAASLAVVAIAGLTARYMARRANLQVSVVAQKARRSVAVLGFKNLSGRPEQAWLSTALSQMLTTELAAGEKLRAIPGETVAQAKLDLSLPDVDTLSRATLGKLRQRLGADLVVLGSYLETGAQGKGRLRLDLRVQDADAGETILNTSAEGTEETLFDVVSKCGGDLRAHLGIGSVPAGEVAGVKAALPSNSEAARLYAEGLTRLRVFDALGARDLLQKATEADRSHALAFSALSEAWSSLGYRPKAADAARRALELSTNLSREHRLWIEGRSATTRADWPKAIDIYRSLFSFFPDNLEYGLQLAATQQFAGQGKEAQATVQILRKLPQPSRDDPRIDLAEGEARESLSENKLAMDAYSAAANKAAASGARLLLARARARQGWMHRIFGEPAAALAAFREAQQIYAAAGDRGEVAQVLLDIGVVLGDQGDLAGSKAMFQQALAVAREIGDSIHVGRALINLGHVLSDAGNAAAAKPLLQEALRVSRENGDQKAVIVVESNLAGLLAAEGNLEGSKKLRRQAADDARLAGDRTAEAAALGGLAEVLFAEGDLAGARQLYERVLPVFEAAGNRRFVANSVQRIADVLWAQGQLEPARARYRQLLKLYTDLDDTADARLTTVYLAALFIDGGQPGQAIPPLRAAIEECRGHKDVAAEAAAETYLAQALLDTRQAEAAQREIDRVRALAGKDGMEVGALIVQARIEAALGRTDEAVRQLRALLKSPAAAGAGEQFQTRLALGEIALRAGKPDGRSLLEQLLQEATARGFALVARQATVALRRSPGSAAGT